MRVSTVCLILLVGCLLSPGKAAVLIREQGNEGRMPRKVDTYNDKIGGSEAEQWRLEDFRDQLVKEPNSQAFIIAYNGRDDNPGKDRRYAIRAKNYLVNARGIDPQRIFTIHGGRREEFAVELWLVPNGAKRPEVTPTMAEPNDAGDNLLYDGYSPGYDNFGSRYEGPEARLDGFAAALKKEPAAWACVIAYAQNGDDRIGVEWDSPDTARQLSLGVKNYLVRRHGLAQSRIHAVNGGYSEERSVELWVMRPKARFDKGPFVYSHRLKSGRGAALTIDNLSRPEVCCRACVRRSAQPNNGMKQRRKSAALLSTKARARR